MRLARGTHSVGAQSVGAQSKASSALFTIATVIVQLFCPPFGVSQRLRE